MKTKANLVGFLLLAIFCYIVRALQNVESIESLNEETNKQKKECSEMRILDATKIVKDNNKIDTHGIFLLNRLNQEHSKKDQKQNAKIKTVNGKINNELRGRPKRKKRRRRHRALMALLLAYKMKFIALIPTMLGGLILLIGKALLVGFFFSLFAAVLSLKGH
ncbi:uncharacterized protein LOC118444956 [Vespa mandarinia]|uniref:uncharacterized protein LOC118444956 n=1 Tax=Vespa mandarinia TaxID=7446 RepID=UPI00161AC65D|nr:uncharacterized protein LOC118444956 [Vespa mandarinia]XP_047370912.1 uncharacterized protein LOC124957730 [Vespa velutina]